MSRPMSQRELRASKNANTSFVTLYNRTTNQPVSIQLRAPKKTDFYVGEQTVVLHCGKTGTFPVSRLYKEQINNHAKAGRISIISGNLEE